MTTLLAKRQQLLEQQALIQKQLAEDYAETLLAARTERDEKLAEICTRYGLEQSDLLEDLLPQAKKASPTKGHKGGPQPKCQDPSTGETWDGRGSPPTWLVNRAIDADEVNERGDWDHDAWLTYGMEHFPVPKKRDPAEAYVSRGAELKRLAEAKTEVVGAEVIPPEPQADNGEPDWDKLEGQALREAVTKLDAAVRAKLFQEKPEILNRLTVH